jgi:hypothetical protein
MFICINILLLPNGNTNSISHYTVQGYFYPTLY